MVGPGSEPLSAGHARTGLALANTPFWSRCNHTQVWPKREQIATVATQTASARHCVWWFRSRVPRIHWSR